MNAYELSAETRTFLENIPIPLAVYQYIGDQIMPLAVSKAYLELFGYGSCQEAVYVLENDLYRNVHPDDIARMEQYSYRFAAHDQGNYDIVFRNKREDQPEYHLIHGTGRHITVGGVRLGFITYADETESAGSDQVVKAMLTSLSGKDSSSESLEFAKHYDRLTGLQNTERFLHSAMAGIEKIWKNGQIPVVMYFDLSGLKKYNSRYGLHAGDRQICALAELIKMHFGRECVSRFESDHFVAYAENRQIESRLRAIFSQMREFGDGDNLAVKTGIFRFENDGTRLTDACSRARLACDSISQTEKSAIAWFDHTIQENTSRKFHIMRNFEKALENGWIQVYYQPIIRSMTKMICGCEALARWKDPEYGMISPGQFIPVLEETGQICRLDLFIFEQVCRDYVRIQGSGDSPVPVSVNLSRKDFQRDDLPDALDRISRKYGVPREYTCLEITESAFVKNIDKVDPLIRRFHQMGYQVWMDDFGSGYSSLGVLKRYSFDELKLDMPFLRDFDERSKKIITSIVRMAKQLNISTLAEGVETEEQYLFLRDIGCEKIQGFYFASPMPVREMPRRMKFVGLAVEPARWRAYYTKLSRIDYLTDQPLCVVDDDGERMTLLFANRTYRENLAKDNVRDLKEWENKINTPGSPIHIFHRQFADQQLRKLDGPKTAAYPSGDHFMQLTGSVAAAQDNRYLYTVHIRYIKINGENFQQTRLETMSDLYYLCHDIAIYDLENDTVMGVKSSLSSQPMGVGVEQKGSSSVINAWKEKYCYLPDRGRYEELMDLSTLRSRLMSSKNGILTGLFRSITADGEYRWFLHILAPIQRSDFRRVLCVTLDAGLDEAGIIKIAASLNGVICGPRSGEITEEVLWKNLIQNAKRMYFWKDVHRRFVGASASFLTYFGLHSVKELIGKTDEDMGWHINPAPFEEDEKEVLRSGKKLYLRKGNCIIHGMNRDIIASKIPVYRDGRVIGLLGTVIDAEVCQKFFAEEKKLTYIDPVTCLANARGISDGMYSYLIERWRTGRNFAMIEVYVPEYREIVQLYGDSSGDCLLREIGKILRDFGGTGCVIGRVEGAFFCLLMNYGGKEEVRELARKIRASVEKLRKAGQWSGNCSARITATYADHASRDRSAYIRGLTDMILSSRDNEEL